jgi:hypothetical protein
VAAVVRDYAALPDALQGLLRDRGFQPRADEVLQLTRFLVEGIATAATHTPSSTMPRSGRPQLSTQVSWCTIFDNRCRA